MSSRSKKSRASAVTRLSSPAERIDFRLVLLIAGAVLLAYVPVYRGEFIWDDLPFVATNPLVHADAAGRWQALAEIWRGEHSIDYFPLTLTWFWLQWQLFGNNPAAFHVVNVLLHAANAILVWRVLRRLGVPGAWLAGLLFGLHPVHAASAAWISEAKNTLSLLLLLLAALGYLRYSTQPKASVYLMALGLFSASMLAKTQGVVFPLVLLLCAWWRAEIPSWRSEPAAGSELRFLRWCNPAIGAFAIFAGVVAILYLRSAIARVQANPDDPALKALNLFGPEGLKSSFLMLPPICFGAGLLGFAVTGFAGRLNRHLVRVAPFLVVAALFGVLTIWFQHTSIGEPIEMGGLARRIANVGLVTWWYLGRLIFPYRLMAVYPPWNFAPPTLAGFLPLLALLFVLGFSWGWRRRGRGLFTALAIFSLIILPISGIITMSYARSGTLVGDHLQYLADVAALAAMSAGATLFFQRLVGAVRIAFAVAGVVIVGLLAAMTWMRASVYAVEERLWRDTLLKNPETWQGHNRQGEILFARGDYAGATPHFERAAELKPQIPFNFDKLGLAYARSGKFDMAIAQFRIGLERGARDQSLSPRGDASIRINLANALGSKAGTLDSTEAPQWYQAAVTEFRKAIEEDPASAGAHRNLAIVLAQLGRKEEAIAELKVTLRLVPNEPVAREMLADLEKQR